MDRMRIYETLQQLHLERERPRVLFDPAVPHVYRADAADLRRLEVVVAAPDAARGAWDAVISAGENGITCTLA
jgi:FAD/FMN-containing dehydrogenase